MALDKNHMSHGGASVQDNDLLDMLDMLDILPWLGPVLEELQYHRNQKSELADERVDYLVNVLDKIGAEYDESDV